MFYTVYKITNKLNGKTYIGSHKTKKLDDGYMGSGKYLKRAIERNGVENFNKEILYVFETPKEMYAKEAELVNEDYLTEGNTYNLKVGGFGGWDFSNKQGKSVLIQEQFERKPELRMKALALAKLAKIKKNPPVYNMCPSCLHEFRVRSGGAKKFCSSSCAASFNNRGVNRHAK